MRRVLLVAAVVLTAAPLRAADDCLAGASALADRRALAALRAATDEACPCASASSRRAWLRCAKAELRASLAAGTLRRPCRATATARLRGTTCGTSRVACARLTPSAKAPVGCRVTRPRACRDRKKVSADACPAETHCADVVDWGGGTCFDPREPGPHPAGVRLVTYTKKSVVNPAEDRVLETVVWYPAAAGAGPVHSTYRAVLDAAPAGGSLPLVVFSHGSCGYPLQSPFLTAHLATWGFVVASVPHPGNTITDFPSCGAPATLGASAQERPADVRFVLDRLLADAADPGSPLFGLVDAARVGMMGHSFGGLTTYLAVGQDPRFRVAVPLAAASPGSVAMTVPSLSMMGRIDSAVSNDAIRAAYAASAAPRYLVEITDAGHYAFSEGCFPSPDCNPPTTLTQSEAHALVLRYVVPFLQVHLAGDPAWAPLLAPPAAPGVALERVL